MKRSVKTAPPASEPAPQLASADIGDLADLRLDYTPRSRGPRGLVVAGLVGACVLGAGLGLWARPAAEERRQTTLVAAPTADPARRQLQIVVDRSLLPPEAPLESAPEPVADEAMAPEVESGFEPPAVVAPRRAPAGLMKVAATETLAEPSEPEAPVARTERKSKARAAKAKVETAALEKARSAQAKADKAETSHLAKRKAKDEASKTAKAKEKAKAAKLARAEEKAGKGEKLAAQKQGRLEKAAKKITKPVARTVKSEVAKAKAAKTARRTELAKTQAAKVEKTKLAKARAESARMEKARLDRARGQRIAQEKKTTLAKRLAEARVKPAPSPRMTTTVSQVERCLDRDPGAALVCADPDLGEQDRRMTRAYRSAQAAGVSQAELQRQHRRWLAARSAAAREAPWAVKDVYQARIAELDDLTREADGGY